MSIILMTTLFYKALILQGENWCWSLLGLKGFNWGGGGGGVDGLVVDVYVYTVYIFCEEGGGW